MQRTTRATNSRIVHQNVDAAEPAIDTLCERFYRGEISYIAFDDFSLAARLRDGCGRGLQSVPGSAANNGDRAHPAHFAGDRRANAASRAGYDRHLPCKELIRIGHKASGS